VKSNIKIHYILNCEDLDKSLVLADTQKVSLIISREGSFSTYQFPAICQL